MHAYRSLAIATAERVQDLIASIPVWLVATVVVLGGLVLLPLSDAVRGLSSRDRSDPVSVGPRFSFRSLAWFALVAVPLTLAVIALWSGFWPSLNEMLHPYFFGPACCTFAVVLLALVDHFRQRRDRALMRAGTFAGLALVAAFVSFRLEPLLAAFLVVAVASSACLAALRSRPSREPSRFEVQRVEPESEPAPEEPSSPRRRRGWKRLGRLRRLSGHALRRDRHSEQLRIRSYR